VLEVVVLEVVEFLPLTEPDELLLLPLPDDPD